MKYFFLETPMSRAEYTRISSKYFTPENRARYHIGGLIAAYRYVYIQIIKVTYGLKQASIIDYNGLISYIEPHRYYAFVHIKIFTITWYNSNMNLIESKT